MVIPIPKFNGPKTLNDFRPVALTSVLMKCFERIRTEILKKTEQASDSLQFAYRPLRGVGDATLILLNLVLKHLDSRCFKSFTGLACS